MLSHCGIVTSSDLIVMMLDSDLGHVHNCSVVLVNCKQYHNMPFLIAFLLPWKRDTSLQLDCWLLNITLCLPLTPLLAHLTHNMARLDCMTFLQLSYLGSWYNSDSTHTNLSASGRMTWSPPNGHTCSQLLRQPTSDQPLCPCSCQATALTMRSPLLWMPPC